MMLLAALFLSYAGFAALCAIARRSLRLVWQKPPKAPVVVSLRIAGFLLIASSWIPCYLLWGTWPMATAAWACLISVSALLFVWPFTYRPRIAVLSGAVSAVAAVILSLIV